MNEELLAASVLFVQSGALLVSHKWFYQPFAIIYPMLSQSKYAVHHQTAMLPQQYWWHLKENYDLNFAFKNADKLLEQKPKAYRQSASTILRY
jgi:hypothetical protein